ncbi:MAG TPA: hypothetical protein VMH26_09980 [Burkholderiales bacterium]|nr:hypothetical protein [Burkholderiales bacterium]
MAKAKPAMTSVARWAKRVERLERSGLSIRTFAAREGLRPGSLSFWKWKLAQQRRNGRAGARPVAPLQFVELTTREAPKPAPTCGFEVVLSSGRVVRLAGGFDAAELARLVGVLEETRS